MDNPIPASLNAQFPIGGVSIPQLPPTLPLPFGAETQPTRLIPLPARGINRLLGATSGAYDGNVRAILAVLMALSFVAILAAVLFLRVYQEAEYLQEIVVGGFGALISAFTLTVGVYIGKRGDGV